MSTATIATTIASEKLPAHQAAAQEWPRDGWLRFRETVVGGLEGMPDALLGLYRGDNLGKMVVRLED
jgi:NADPH-dependent curcumin reductase CurA